MKKLKSENPVAGTLNLYRETPETSKKESNWSNLPVESWENIQNMLCEHLSENVKFIPCFECFLGIVELYHSDSFSRRQVCDSWRVWEMVHVTSFKRAVFVKNIIECNNNVYLYSPKLILNYIAAAALLPVQSSYTIRWWFSSFFCSTILEISL